MSTLKKITALTADKLSGVLRSVSERLDPIPVLSEETPVVFFSNDSECVPVGTSSLWIGRNAAGESIYTAPLQDLSSAVAVVAPSYAGRNQTLRTLAAGLLAKGVEVVAVDPRNIFWDFAAEESFSSIFSSHQSLEEADIALKRVVEQVKERQNQQDAPYGPMVVFLAHSDHYLPPTSGTAAENEVMRSIQESTKTLLEQGAKAGVYIISGSARPTSGTLVSDLIQQAQTVIAVGHLTPSMSHFVFGEHHQDVLSRIPHKPGFGVVQHRLTPDFLVPARMGYLGEKERVQKAFASIGNK